MRIRVNAAGEDDCRALWNRPRFPASQGATPLGRGMKNPTASGGAPLNYALSLFPSPWQGKGPKGEGGAHGCAPVN
jgi:hypothetical protein